MISFCVLSWRVRKAVISFCVLSWRDRKAVISFCLLSWRVRKRWARELSRTAIPLPPPPNHHSVNRSALHSFTCTSKPKPPPFVLLFLVHFILLFIVHFKAQASTLHIDLLSALHSALHSALQSPSLTHTHTHTHTHTRTQRHTHTPALQSPGLHPPPLACRTASSP